MFCESSIILASIQQKKMKEEIECEIGSSLPICSVDDVAAAGDGRFEEAGAGCSSSRARTDMNLKLASLEKSSLSAPSSSRQLSTSFVGNNNSSTNMMVVQQQQQQPRNNFAVNGSKQEKPSTQLVESKPRTDYPDYHQDKNGKKYVNNQEEEIQKKSSRLRKLYIKYFRNVFLADEDDQLKYQMKIRAAEEQYKILILLGLSLNLITSIFYIEWNFIRQVNFFSLCFLDTFLDIVVQLLLIFCGAAKDLPTLELAHVFKNLILGSVRAVNQIYSGFYSPIWIMNGFALLIFSHVAFFRNSLSLISCLTLIFSSMFGQYVSFQVMFSEVERGGRFITLTHLEKQTPHMHMVLNSSIYLQTILQNTIIQVFILALGIMFSRDVEEQYSRSIRFEYQIKTERFLNASKTKFIGNLSHEVSVILICTFSINYLN